MKRVIASFARNTVFANILLVLIFLVGGFAIKNMVRENFTPEQTRKRSRKASAVKSRKRWKVSKALSC